LFRLISNLPNRFAHLLPTQKALLTISFFDFVGVSPHFFNNSSIKKKKH